MLRGGKDESLNLRGAYLEVLGDLVGSVAVVVAAVVILTTGWTRADAIASVLVVCLIVPRAWALIRDVVDVLLEATPRGVDLATVRTHIEETPGVVEVHDLHVWTITSGLPVLSAHVVVAHDHLAARPFRGDPRQPRQLPRRALRRRPLHVPARARGPPRPRAGPPRLTLSAPPRPPRSRRWA